jgi:hypothetical protein
MLLILTSSLTASLVLSNNSLPLSLTAQLKQHRHRQAAEQHPPPLPQPPLVFLDPHASPRATPPSSRSERDSHLSSPLQHSTSPVSLSVVLPSFPLKRDSNGSSSPCSSFRPVLPTDPPRQTPLPNRSRRPRTSFTNFVPFPLSRPSARPHFSSSHSVSVNRR